MLCGNRRFGTWGAGWSASVLAVWGRSHGQGLADHDWVDEFHVVLDVVHSGGVIGKQALIDEVVEFDDLGWVVVFSLVEFGAWFIPLWDGVCASGFDFVEGHDHGFDSCEDGFATYGVGHVVGCDFGAGVADDGSGVDSGVDHVDGDADVFRFLVE